MKEALFNLVLAVIPIVGALAVRVSIPLVNYIKARLGETNFNKAWGYAAMIIQSVEQTMGGGNGAAKKKVVVDLLTKNLGKYLTAQEIDHLIEAIVYQFNESTKQASNPTLTLPVDQPKDNAASNQQSDQNAALNWINNLTTGNVPEMKGDTASQPDSGQLQQTSTQSQFTNEQINNIANAVAQAAVSAISQNGVIPSTTA